MEVAEKFLNGIYSSYVVSGRYLTCLVRNLLLASKFAYAGVQGYDNYDYL